MKDKLRKHIETLFEETPVTKQTIELKEEVYMNSLERFEDLTAEGMAEEDAYKLVINSIGNIHELIDQIVYEDKDDFYDRMCEKTAIIKGIAAGLYIMIVVGFFGGLYFAHNGLAAICIAAFIAVFPVGLHVYAISLSSKYLKNSATMVDDFREWQTSKQSYQEIKNACIAILWLLILILYFVISFATGAWYITWVLFLVGICLTIVISLIFSLKRSNA